MPESESGGGLALSISNAMVQLIRETTGRGPTKARTTIGRDHVLVMLRDTLTKGERKLAANGYGEESCASVTATRRSCAPKRRP